MEYNICETCDAKDGRAGMLIGLEGLPMECKNCSDTRKTGKLVLHTNLPRTNEEVKLMVQRIIDKTQPTISDYLGVGYDMSGDGGCGDFTNMVHMSDAKEAMLKYAKDKLTEALRLYVSDGNPSVWRAKIIELKDSLK